ncbi:hypothetical protein CB0940_03474 [Cercospora beticola]|uniref:Uncharacterized protein n=1 Tax=Cercospora beticola TaxID=122368 RepID=A0A2G5I578_CERBT|nr:hypothetical protein CB0940_03474 [Cercospora beticola]PIA99954.1 hypothetical protein CB0940_03474 [Cercospora beticola]WPB00649.1 hypothetical protein RHO25_005269 [Cercospora beticola]CAK1361120.1 unnamed protein product [Cercospora beticola]
MAEQWEQAFKGFGEKTYTIAQALQNANEGDDLSETLKEIKEAHDELLKESKKLPTDVVDVDDESAQADLKNAANDVVIASNKLIAAAQEKADVFRPNKDLGKIVNKTVLTNSSVLDAAYPLTNPYAPEIQGQTKKCQSEAVRVMKLLGEPKEE